MRLTTVFYSTRSPTTSIGRACNRVARLVVAPERTRSLICPYDREPEDRSIQKFHRLENEEYMESKQLVGDYGPEKSQDEV